MKCAPRLEVLHGNIQFHFLMLNWEIWSEHVQSNASFDFSYRRSKITIAIATADYQVRKIGFDRKLKRNDSEISLQLY